MNEHYFSAITAGWAFWGPIAFLMYTVVPLHARVIFAQLASLIWNTYMSWKANLKLKNVKHGDQPVVE